MISGLWLGLNPTRRVATGVAFRKSCAACLYSRTAFVTNSTNIAVHLVKGTHAIRMVAIATALYIVVGIVIASNSLPFRGAFVIMVTTFSNLVCRVFVSDWDFFQLARVQRCSRRRTCITWCHIWMVRVLVLESDCETVQSMIRNICPWDILTVAAVAFCKSSVKVAAVVFATDQSFLTSQLVILVAIYASIETYKVRSLQQIYCAAIMLYRPQRRKLHGQKVHIISWQMRIPPSPMPHKWVSQ